MRYRYLLIDNDNTLMDFSAAEHKALNETLEAAGLPTDEDTVAAYVRINDALWKALERGETTQAALKIERFAQLLDYLGMPRDTAPQLGAAYAENLGHHADLLPDAMAFMVISSRASGTSGFTSRGARGMEDRCCSATETALSPSKGRRPVSIS